MKVGAGTQGALVRRPVPSRQQDLPGVPFVPAHTHRSDRESRFVISGKVALSVAVFLGVAATLSLLWWPRPGLGATEVAGPPDGPPSPRPGTLASSPRPSGRRESLPSVAEILVRDEAGAAVADAGIWRDPDDVVLTRSAREFLGATDAAGARTVEVGAGTTLLGAIGKAGFMTQACAFRAGEQTLVTLRRGHRLEFLCQDLEGRPLPDAMVAVSSHWLPEGWLDHALDPGGAVPGVEPRVAMTWGVADAAGVAVLEGVPEGRLKWGTYHPDYEVVNEPSAGASDGEGLTCPGPRRVIGFAVLAAAGCRVENDEVVWGRGRLRTDGRYHPARPDSNVAYARALEQVRRRHRPDAFAVMPFANLDPAPEIEWDLLLLEKGRIRRVVPYMSLREFDRRGPLVIDAAELPATGAKAGAVTVRVINGDGLPLERVRLSIQVGDTFSEFRSGAVCRFPVGCYRLAAVEPSIDNSLPSPCDIEITEQHAVHDVRLSRVLYPVRLRKVTEPAHWARRVGVLTLKFENGATRSDHFSAGDELDLLLARGRVIAELNCRGSTGPVEFVVGGEGRSEPLVVDLLVKMR